MPTGKNWFNFTYVNLGFIVGLFTIYYFTYVKEIYDNWPEYRCNPMYMPLSKNLKEDFTFCVQNMQKGMMGNMLQPLTYVVSNVGNTSNDIMNSMNDVREMFNKVRGFTGDIVQNIFGAFLNIVIEFQKITISIKDLVAKVIGTMVVLLYLMDGSIKTMKSAWNGPPGQLTRGLGKCFHPETKVKLKNGSVVCMKDLNLGDILDGGSRVISVMKIDNTDPETYEDLYVLRRRGVECSDIYVTGSHLIMEERNCKFVKVADYYGAEKQNEVKTDWFSCLVTSDNRIQLGKETFWDWEDHIQKIKMQLSI